MRQMEITFEIEKHIGTINAVRDGWSKEVNLVSWNGNKAKVDIRDWDEEHTMMSRGITLTHEQMDRLCDLWTEYTAEEAHENVENSET